MFKELEYRLTKYAFVCLLAVFAFFEYFWFHWYLYTGRNAAKTVVRIRRNRLCPHTVLQLWVDHKLEQVQNLQ